MGAVRMSLDALKQFKNPFKGRDLGGAVSLIRKEHERQANRHACGEIAVSGYRGDAGVCQAVAGGASRYEAVGGLDERLGMGFFDDDDPALRARQAGFELAVAQDLFVHHFGS
jgi:GT2 family glycosyltransferase